MKVKHLNHITIRIAYYIISVSVSINNKITLKNPSFPCGPCGCKLWAKVQNSLRNKVRSLRFITSVSGDVS